MHIIFGFLKSSKYSFLQLVRHILAILQREKFITLTYVWFELKAPFGVLEIFKLRGRIDTAIGLDLSVDFISNLSYCNFILVLVYGVFILYLALLRYIKFVFCRCISL